MDYQPIILVLALILGLFIISKQNIKKEKEIESFCPRGYCPENMQNRQELLKNIQQRFPCSKKYSTLGYDNPYIYPYNYFWNQTHPASKYKFPEWTRQLTRSLTEDYGLPGYGM